MPKLTKKVANQVAKTEAASGSFLLPEGRYAARLLEVNEKEGKVAPYWQWVLGDIHSEDGAPKPGKQWHNTSTSDRAFSFLKGTFDAFGYTPDSDTDEMLGEWVTIYLVQQPIPSGPKAGEMRNQIQSLHEFDPDEFEFDVDDVAPLKGAAGSTEEDEY